jgi:hypothetical protein
VRGAAAADVLYLHALMLKPLVFLLTIFATAITAAAQGRSWILQLEEPTGIDRRDNEVVRFVATFAPGQVHAGQVRVLDDESRELPVQVVVADTHPDSSIKSTEILFPATLIPGRLSRYRLLAIPLAERSRKPGERGGDYLTDIVVRRLGTSRLELGNSRFGLIINLGRDNTMPAIVEAYNRAAGEHRIVNLVETTPDIREELPFGVRSAGWGTASVAPGISGFTIVDVLESGPLRARVRLKGTADEWEFEWYANSPIVVWRARTRTSTGSYGFFFSAVSAFPYEPFTHWADGAEIGWPDGDTNNPPHKKIVEQTPAARPAELDHLPGGHVLYYNPQENYGALDFIELDSVLKWSGIGFRQFYARRELGGARPQSSQTGISAIRRTDLSSGWSSQIAIAFPLWRGNETLLEARADYRRFAQPILVHSLDAQPLGKLPSFTPAPRTASYQIERVPVNDATPRSGVIELSLDGPWRLRDAEKGDGETERLFEIGKADSDWQIVQVPGAVHTQILKYPAYYSHEAEWISFKEWWYRKRFSMPAAMKGKRVRLQFGATDYC